MPKAINSGYSGLQIALHWVIASLVLFQLLFGESMTAVVDAAEEGGTVDPLDQSLSTAHYWVGIAILALVALRIVVRLVQGAPAVTTPSTLMTRAAFATHMAFYVLLVAVPTTGLLGFYLGDPWGEFHAFAKPVFIVLIVVHAAAALFHQFWLKDGTLRKMLVPAR